MLLMVLNALNQIANNFINEKIIDVNKAKIILNKILKELGINEKNNFKCIVKKTNYYDHFSSIDQIRKFLFSTTNLTNQEIENKINLLLSYFLPSQNELNKVFNSINKPYEYLKTLSLLSYYIKKDKNDKNIIFEQKTKYGNLKISINKAKPEKTVEDIIKAKNIKVYSKGPKCPICVENIGYSTNSFSDSRENLRVKFIELSNGKWFFQYSPYSYVNNHFVLNNFIHTPMKISNDTVKNLIMFVDKNPKYFLGSNADLEIVGGSLLSHDHYQGGEDSLPIMNAKVLKRITVFNSIIEILKWPLNAIRIISKNKEELYTLVSYVITNWKHADNIANVKNINNNSSTLILNKKKNIYHFYIIFRNNTISKSRPYGNFHFHHNKFNIKQENIGLMEAAGLAILPKRLEEELLLCVNFVKENKIDQIKNSQAISKHYNWIKLLIKQNKKIDKRSIFKFASEVFVKGLEDCRIIDNKLFIKYINSLFVDNDIIISNNNNLKIVINKRGFTFKEMSLNNKQYLLRYNNEIDYYSNSMLLNSFVGPVAGRIQNGYIKFPFNNKEFNLPVDNNKNYIHSMSYNLSLVNFNFSKIKESEKAKTIIGFKKIFNNDLNVTYYVKIKLNLFNNENKILINYLIKANDDFIANPTHHFYFSFNDNNIDINKYMININKDNKVWYLSKKMNPIYLKKISLKNEFNFISSIASELNENQHRIVNGLIDHPFINNKKEIILKDNNNQINLSSKIRDFVIYTQNYSSDEQLNSLLKNKTNCGVCIEFQNTPTSISNCNYNDICFKRKDVWKNSIKLLIFK